MAKSREINMNLPSADDLFTTQEERDQKNYGKVSMGVVRTTYLIDENGIIIKANDKVKAADDPD